MLIVLLACTGTSSSTDTSDSEFGSDPRTDDTAVIPEGTFALSDGVVLDEDGDGAWSPGEAAVVEVLLTNTGSEDFMHYPGVLLSVDNEAVALEVDDWYLYGLEAGASQPATFNVLAAGTLETGTTITFTAIVDVLNCEEDECPEPGDYSFSDDIEEDIGDDTGI